MLMEIITIYGKEVEAEVSGNQMRIQSVHDLPKEKVIGETVAVRIRADVSSVQPFTKDTIRLKARLEVNGETIPFSEIMRVEDYEKKNPKELTVRVNAVVTAYNEVTDSFTVKLNRKQFDISAEAVKVLYVNGWTVRIG